MNRGKSFLAALALVLGTCLAGCSSGPAIRADADPAANLPGYKTFGFFENMPTDKHAYGTILTTRLKDAARRELEKRGYQYVQSGPQLLVNFNLNIQDRTDVQSTMSTGGYYGYRSGMYGMWAGYPQDIQTVHYQEGTLSIDLVDASRRQLVWQGVAQGRINRSSAENPGPAIDTTVAQIFAKFPVPAAAAPASAPAA